jgi:hypothetical protein
MDRLMLGMEPDDEAEVGEEGDLVRKGEEGRLLHK